jgi:hypothetical protein
MGAEWLRPLVRLYPVLVRAGLRSMIQRLLMPSAHLPAVRGLDHPKPAGAAQFPWRVRLRVRGGLAGSVEPLARISEFGLLNT